MTMAEYKLEKARQVIRDCEEYQLEGGSEYSRQEEKRTAYERLKEILWED